jgi:hypothetical protein
MKSKQIEGKFVGNPYYVEYERLLRELHRLIAEGRGDTEEADLIRDDMDVPERKLSREEQDRLDGLSADLYMLQEDEVFEPVDPDERTTQRLGVELKSAWDRGDWETVLKLLRKGPAFLSQDRIAYMRAKAYEELGHLETSRLFREYAARINPESSICSGLFDGIT